MHSTGAFACDTAPLHRTHGPEGAAPGLAVPPLLDGGGGASPTRRSALPYTHSQGRHRSQPHDGSASTSSHVRPQSDAWQRELVRRCMWFGTVTVAVGWQPGGKQVGGEEGRAERAGRWGGGGGDERSGPVTRHKARASDGGEGWRTPDTLDGTLLHIRRTRRPALRRVPGNHSKPRRRRYRTMSAAHHSWRALNRARVGAAPYP